MALFFVKPAPEWLNQSGF